MQKLMKLRGLGWAVSLLSLVAFTACGSGSSSGSGNAVDAAGNDSKDKPQDDTKKAPPPEANCSASPKGAVRTTYADIIYQNNDVQVTASHLRGNGCVLGMDLSFSISGGCMLSLTFTSDENNKWKLGGGQFIADSHCGEYWPTEANGTYEIDMENSNGALMELPTAVDYPEADASCAQAESIELAGKIRFVSAQDPLDLLDITLVGLKVSGTILSNAADEGSCPWEFESCVGVSCGEDAYGVACGGCEGELSCVAGVCQASACLTEGDGKTVGYHIADILWADSEGEQVNLHDFCKAPAVWIIKTAGW